MSRQGQQGQFGLEIDVDDSTGSVLSSSFEEQVYLESLGCLNQLEEEEELFRTVLEQSTTPSNTDVTSPLQQRKLHYHRDHHQQQYRHHTGDPPPEIQWNDTEIGTGSIFYRNNQDTLARLYTLEIDHDVEDLTQYKLNQCLRSISRRPKKRKVILVFGTSISFIISLYCYRDLVMNLSLPSGSSSKSSRLMWRLWWTESIMQKKNGSMEKTMSTSNSTISTIETATVTDPFQTKSFSNFANDTNHMEQSHNDQRDMTNKTMIPTTTATHIKHQRLVPLD